MSTPLPPSGSTDWYTHYAWLHAQILLTAKAADLATVATSGSASDLASGTLADARIPSGITRDTELTAHTGRTDNPHSTTKAQVGLANADNTSDVNKPVSTATQTALNAKVSTTERGPIGGVSSTTYSASTFTLPITHLQLRWTLNGNVTVNVPGAGAEGQRILIEARANSGTRSVTFAIGFEVSQSVPGRVFTIPSGEWGYFALIYRSGTWRLMGAEPQTVSSSSIPASSAWLPAEHGLLAWVCDPVLAGGSVAVGGGFAYHSAVKLDEDVLVSSVVCGIETAGVGLTAATCYAGVYDATGARVGLTGDQSGTWNSVGAKTMPLAASANLTAGVYYILAIATATTTSPSFSAVMSGGALYPRMFGRSTAALRAGRTSGTYTSLPTTKPSVFNVTPGPIWFGLA